MYCTNNICPRESNRTGQLRANSYNHKSNASRVWPFSMWNVFSETIFRTSTHDACFSAYTLWLKPLRMFYGRLRPRITSPRAIFPTILPSLPPRRMTHSSPYRQLRTALRHDTTSSRGRASLRLSTAVSPSTERQSRMAVSPPCSINSSVHASSALCIALLTAERLLQSRSCATQCSGSSMTIRRVAGYWPTPSLTSRAEAGSMWERPILFTPTRARRLFLRMPLHGIMSACIYYIAIHGCTWHRY